jgi:glycosyltransferase involved in cell wall biosynthesis
MRILLIEPYFGGSHRAWAEGYARHSRYSVDLLTMSARFWKWRMHGGAVTLAARALQKAAQPDLLLVSDMVNLPAFLGLTRHRLGAVPTALYCHENQLTYPVPPGEKRDLTYGMINWTSMVAADKVFFNSHYHLEDWFDALPRLLKHFPDYSHLHCVAEVRAKSSVLPLGCDLRRFDGVEAKHRVSAPPLILWNQRWEYDKDPRTFFRALDVLARDGIAFHVALAGSNVRQMPEEFEAAREKLGERVIHYGRADQETYARLLRQADVVVSTAIHEFFGIAAVEAIYCGCFPILPRRLAYPELIPGSYHDRCLYDDFDGLVARLHWALTQVGQAQELGNELGGAVAHFDWGEMAPQYDAALRKVAGRSPRSTAWN